MVKSLFLSWNLILGFQVGTRSEIWINKKRNYFDNVLNLVDRVHLAHYSWKIHIFSMYLYFFKHKLSSDVFETLFDQSSRVNSVHLKGNVSVLMFESELDRKSDRILAISDSRHPLYRLKMSCFSQAEYQNSCFDPWKWKNIHLRAERGKFFQLFGEFLYQMFILNRWDNPPILPSLPNNSYGFSLFSLKKTGHPA